MQTIFYELNRQLTLEKQLSKLGSVQERQALEDKLEELRQGLQPPPPGSTPGETNPQSSPESSNLGGEIQSNTIEKKEPFSFPQKLTDAQIKQFEKILTSERPDSSTEISQQQSNDPELEQYRQFLNLIEPENRKSLVNLAKEIQTTELDFLLEEQNQEFWRVLNVLNDIERSNLIKRIDNSKLKREEIKKFGKGNVLWEILGVLNREEQENLRETEQKLESLKQKKAEIEKQLQEVETRINQKREREIENKAIARAFFIGFLEDWNNQSKDSVFQLLSKELGIKPPSQLETLKKEWKQSQAILLQNEAELDKFIEKYKLEIQPLIEQANQIKYFLENKPAQKITGLIEFFKQNRGMLVVFVLLLALPFVVYYLLSLVPQIFDISTWLAKVLAVLKVALTALVSIPGLARVPFILERVTVWQSAISRRFYAFQESAAEEQQKLAAVSKQTQSLEIQQLQAQLDTTQSEIAKLEVRAEAQRRQAGLTLQYSSLLEFVNDRLEADSYQKRLGLMHQIKRDLEDLSDRLTYDSKNSHPERLKALQNFFPRGVARVVLYIDDLDRCPPNRVVEVLEAVQLLLTTRLFIVVIAVDDRYINRALENTYQGILKRRGTPSGVDYLEKIIQIPYRMRAISEKSVLDSYLRSQLDFIEEPEAEPEADPKVGSQNTLRELPPSKVEPLRETDSERSDRREREEILAVRGPAPDNQLDDSSSDKSPAAPQPVPSSSRGDFIEIAKFNQEEFQTILDCCQYVDLTPRTTKRIINLCKILKLIWTPTPKDTRWAKEPNIAVRQTVIAFLALSGRYPNQVRCVLEEIVLDFEKRQLEIDNQNGCLEPDQLELKLNKTELLDRSEKHYPLRDSYTRREWKRFKVDVK